MAEIVKPIIFNTPMVKALLTGQKSVTRRLVKPLPKSPLVFDGRGWVETEPWAGGNICTKVPPYQVGDVLYVRETWRFVPCDDCKLNRDYPCYMETTTFDNGAGLVEGCFDYRASAPDDPARWYPSIHMPKKAARIYRKVKAVRAEWLQDITDAGAVAEGVKDRAAFAALWDTTIKKNELPEYGWAANPWVWVVEFERYDPPVKLPQYHDDGCMDGQHSGLVEED